MNWEKIPLRLSRYPSKRVKLEKPENAEKMKEVAEHLAEGIPFVRVDLYNVNSQIIFGEMTFCPGGGFERISPYEWDYKLGMYMNISSYRENAV